jgi:hypothetical protein
MENLALDWLSQVEGGFFHSLSTTNPDYGGSSFSPGGSKARAITGFVQGSKVFSRAVSLKVPISSKGFISSLLDVKE